MNMFTAWWRYKQGNDGQCDKLGAQKQETNTLPTVLLFNNKAFYVCLHTEGKKKNDLPCHIARSLFCLFVFFLQKLHWLAFPEGAALHPGCTAGNTCLTAHWQSFGFSIWGLEQHRFSLDGFWIWRIHTYLHPYIHTDIHTYIHKYQHGQIKVKCREAPSCLFQRYTKTNTARPICIMLTSFYILCTFELLYLQTQSIIREKRFQPCVFFVLFCILEERKL